MRRRLRVFFCLFATLACHAFALDRQPSADYHARREALAKRVGGVIVLMPPRGYQGNLYEYRQDNNFYYLTGLTMEHAAIVIAPAAEAKGSAPARSYTEVLFLPTRVALLEKFYGTQLGPENPDAPKITGFDQVRDMTQLPETVAKLAGGPPSTIYTDVGSATSPSDDATWLSFLRKSRLYTSFEDVVPHVTALRMRKDAGELALLRKAVDNSIAAHIAASRAIKPNVREYEISAMMQYEWLKRGSERAAYPPIVGSGLNSTVLHYAENTNLMKSGDVVVIDAAAEYSMYAADITRTFPVNGHFTARQREIYDIVLGAQRAAEAAFQSGKSLLNGDAENSLNKAAKEYMRTHGKDLHDGTLDKYFIHGLGHHIGLDVHDDADYKVPLGPGMTFTIEPGIYIPEENFGVRIEDDYYVDESGKLIKLSEALPSKAEDVEKVMAGK